MESNRRSFLKRNLALGSGLLFANSIDAVGSVAKKINTIHSSQRNVHIAYTNDINGQLSPVIQEIGGLEAVSGAVLNYQERSLLLDAGNFLGADAELDSSVQVITLMNKMGYDAVNIGPAELAGGVAYLETLVPYMAMPLLNANYRFDSKILSKAVVPHITLNYGKFKIGVTGIGANLSLPGVKVLDPISVLSNISSTLKNIHHCDLVICLSHLGEPENSDYVNREMATESANVDMIIAGKNHKEANGLKVLRNVKGDEVFITNNQSRGLEHSRLTFNFSEDKARVGVALDHFIPSHDKLGMLAKLKVLNNNNI